jgi:hypothetical protein
MRNKITLICVLACMMMLASDVLAQVPKKVPQPVSTVKVSKPSLTAVYKSKPLAMAVPVQSDKPSMILDQLMGVICIPDKTDPERTQRCIITTEHGAKCLFIEECPADVDMKDLHCRGFFKCTTIAPEAKQPQVQPTTPKPVKLTEWPD